MKRGSVVLVRFPFSDLSASKLRPAIILAKVGRGDYILVQVTSNPYGDELAIELTDDSFQTGSLKRTSYARPGKLFTANESLMERTVGELSATAVADLVSVVTRILGG